jgi:uncharacterized membrane protein
MNGKDIGKAWRRSDDVFMNRRRRMAGLSLLNIVCMCGIAAYQMRVVNRLPNPKFANFEAEYVAGSAEAYSILETPDAVLGLCSYAATLGLTAMGGPNRDKERPWLPVLASGKALLDLTVAASLVTVQVVRIRKLCWICLLTAASTTAIAGLSLMEAKAAMDHT